MVKTPGNERLNNLNDPVLNVLRINDWVKKTAILMAVENLGSKREQTHQELPPKVPIQSSSNHSYNYPAIPKSSYIWSYSLLCLKFSALRLPFSQTDVF